MALPTIRTTDFSGPINVSQNTYGNGVNDFQAAIDAYLAEFVVYYLGIEAYTDIVNNTRDRWVTFFSGTTWTNEFGKVYTLFPVEDVIKNWIYTKWIQRQAFINTDTGLVANLNENSNSAGAGTIGVLGTDRLFWASTQWLSAIAFLEEYRQVTEPILAASGTGAVTVTVSATTYLENGDTVSIDGTDYVVSSVNATTFVVQSASGSGFNTATWQPFGVVCSPIKTINVGFF